MTVLETDTDRLVVRIVYAGPPSSGKTETLRQLMKLFGGTITSVPDEETTLDWAECQAGVFLGKPILAQIVAVSGAAERAAQRKRLVESADAIVFVMGSQPAEVIDALSYLDELQSWMSRANRDRPTPVIIQCNKRDLSGAISVPDIKTAMCLSGGEVHASTASAGEGIQVPYISATRACIAGARTLYDSDKLQRGAVDFPYRGAGSVAKGHDTPPIASVAVQQNAPPSAPVAVQQNAPPIASVAVHQTATLNSPNLASTAGTVTNADAAAKPTVITPVATPRATVATPTAAPGVTVAPTVSVGATPVAQVATMPSLMRPGAQPDHDLFAFDARARGTAPPLSVTRERSSANTSPLDARSVSFDEMPGWEPAWQTPEAKRVEPAWPAADAKRVTWQPPEAKRVEQPPLSRLRDAVQPAPHRPLPLPAEHFEARTTAPPAPAAPMPSVVVARPAARTAVPAPPVVLPGTGRVIEGARPQHVVEVHPHGPPARLLGEHGHGPQIASNLEHPTYVRLLAKTIEATPDVSEVGLVNVTSGKACLAFASHRTASTAEHDVAVALCQGLLPSATAELKDEDLFLSIFASFTPLRLVYFLVGSERVFMRPINGGREVQIAITSGKLNLGSSRMLLAELEGIDSLSSEAAQLRLQGLRDVLAVVVVDIETGIRGQTHELFTGATTLSLDAQLGHIARQLFNVDATPAKMRLVARDGEPLRADSMFIDDGRRGYYFSRMSFDRDHVLYFVAGNDAPQGLNWYALTRAMNDTMRMWVAELLGQGLDTMIEPFPRTDKEFYEIVEELRTLKPDDLIGRLRIGGFLDHQVTVDGDLQRCKECIYYLPNAKWCDLPELPIPVEAEWWCRLWKL